MVLPTSLLPSAQSKLNSTGNGTISSKPDGTADNNVFGHSTGTTNRSSGISGESHARKVGHTEIKVELTQVEAVIGDSPLQIALARSSKDAADTILAAIEREVASLEAKGADQATIKSTLEAASRGFRDGYLSAVDSLESAGLFKGPLKEAVEETRNLFHDGLRELRRAHLQAAPTQPGTPGQPETFAQPDIVNSSEKQYQPRSFSLPEANSSDLFSQTSKTRFELSVTTQEGDIITLRLNQQSGQSLTERQHQNSQSEQYSIEIIGDLNSAEQQALDDIITDAQAVAGEFLTGRTSAAADLAANIRFDSTQLSTLDLNIKTQSVSKAVSTYEDISRQHPLAGDDASTLIRENKAKFDYSINDLIHQAMAFQQPDKLVYGLIEIFVRR